MRDFVATIIVRAIEDDADAQKLKAAIEAMIARAARFPVDSRFDWETCHVETERHGCG